MENLSNNEDLMDRLLRQNLPGYRLPQACTGFDADLANAYVEQVLTPAEQQNYEEHLAHCSDCRQNLQSLMLLVNEVTLPSPLTPNLPAAKIFTVVENAVEKTVENVNPVENISLTTAKPVNVVAISEKRFPQTAQSRLQWTRSQWVLAVAAMLIVFIGVGVIVRTRLAQTPNIATAPSASNPTVASSQAPPTSVVTLPSSNDVNTVTASVPKSAGSSPLAPNTANNSDTNNTSQEDSRVIDSTLSTPNPNKNITSPAPLPTLPGQTSGSEQLADLGNDARPVDVPATNANNSSPLPPSEIAKNETPSENIATRPRANGAAGGFGLTERDVLRTKKVQNKVFTLVNGVWTDGEYLRNVKLPIIVLEKNSAEYRKLLQSEPELKNYLFNRNIIIVYKGAAYKFM
jgi:hypothetical protein